MSLPFHLPRPKGFTTSPEWNGMDFSLGDYHTPVLVYGENPIGWSDSLTTLLEEACGGRHPIDMASRYDAVAQVEEWIPSSRPVIMEIGCSSGFLIRDFKKHFPDAVIIGTDVFRESLFRLAEKGAGIPLLCFDFMECPVPNESIDVLVMLNVLEHIKDDNGALEKAFDLLKPGGVLILEVPSGPNLYGPYDVELHHFRRYSSVKLQKKLRCVGFKICRNSHLGFFAFPFFLINKVIHKYFSCPTANSFIRGQAVHTVGLRLLRWSLELEARVLSRFSLPMGIRVLLTAQRPL